ncbi:MAG: hypothetical protein QG625_4244 [Cyanobacteriota bacterium erpe_2018_sw_39hr_WHONDRS-SW48-000098_B_bin.30]|nr:hypothetical protein [Cyanobacteriota bacterium erpe_2018_sw_39hr_WHONDRS-SW48-000098_B_bin.30]
MKHFIAVALTLFISTTCAHGQTEVDEVQVSGPISSNPLSGSYDGYLKEFNKALTPSFSESDLDQIFRNYHNLIMPGVDTEQLVNEIQGRETTYFPLTKLKTETDYDKNIKTLLESKNQYQRLFGYISVASAGDQSFNNVLLSAAKTESFKAGRYWAGNALLYLQDKHTSKLFDFLVECEDFEDAHMMPFYLRLDKDAIRRTACEKIKSKKPKAKILAVQTLAETELNNTTEQVVKDAVRAWDSSIRGYAIYTVRALCMGNLKDLLSPLLKDKSIRDVCLGALANSPTPADQEFLLSLVPKNSEIPEDILNAYLESKREDSVRTWLRLVREGQVNQNYNFFVSEHELLISDDLLDEVRDTIRRTKNHTILHELPRALAERRDNESVQLLIQLLSDSDSTVRYWAANSLKENSSPELLEKLPQLIRNPKLRTTALTKLAIQNKIDGLQDVYVSLLQKDSNNSTDWYRSSLQYLAAFPRAKDKDLFISILQGKQDAFVKRFAVAGLGQLHDQSSVPLIENALRQEPPHDLNAITYLTALGKIKGAKAKQIIESYKDSKIDSVRTLAAKLLSDW